MALRVYRVEPHGLVHRVKAEDHTEPAAYLLWQEY